MIESPIRPNSLATRGLGRRCRQDLPCWIPRPSHAQSSHRRPLARAVSRTGGRTPQAGGAELSAGRSGACSPACREVPIDITFLRTEDIPVLCAEGAIDMGITGGDLVDESRASMSTTRLDLGVGECRLALCVPRRSRKIQAAQRLAWLPRGHELSARHADRYLGSAQRRRASGELSAARSRS